MHRKCLSLVIVLGLCTAVPALAQTKPNYGDLTAATATVADAYVAAYTALDWDRLEPLLADNVSFRDPTAELIFGSPSASNKETLMKQLRQNVVIITKMSFQRRRGIYSGQYGLYDGDLTFAVHVEKNLVVESTTPIVLAIRVEEGKVVEHRDYVDYAPFLTALKAAQKDRK